MAEGTFGRQCHPSRDRRDKCHSTGKGIEHGTNSKGNEINRGPSWIKGGIDRFLPGVTKSGQTSAMRRRTTAAPSLVRRGFIQLPGAPIEGSHVFGFRNKMRRITYLSSKKEVQAGLRLL